MVGKLYGELYQRSRRGSDRTKSRLNLENMIRKFPDDPLRAQAESILGITSGEESMASGKPTAEDAVSRIIQNETKKNQETNPLIRKKNTGGISVVNGLRFWSNPQYTRVVIDAEQETTFSYRLLRKDPAIKKPQRLYIDLDNTRLSQDIQKLIPINDNLLLDARAGQYRHDQVRVVVDIKSFQSYKIFPLKNPFRIVVDVWGKETSTADNTIRPSPPSNTNTKAVPGDLAKQLALGVRKIVIDPGHGGKDYGAPGYYKGTHEKNIVLAIGKKLAAKIRKTLNCEVVMTRSTDKYLSLEERTAIANTQNADLFISIHTNAAKDKRAYGIETFFLNLATDEDAILVAARENATSTKNISDLESILNDLMQNAKINESSRLAGQVQHSLSRHLNGKFSKIKNKGVKQAPFYVLMGAQMPAILIETSFISNPRECKRLTSASYQDQLCEGIILGIKKYIQVLNPTALSPDYTQSRSEG
ncbi:MAG: N-acetylmuramoyl-L-alanine amidase [Desulfobacteraceae bacterium]|nr:N-acetylmuramoyl-L-alanine amidase [Desulfobacteraceae bacterium]